MICKEDVRLGIPRNGLFWFAAVLFAAGFGLPASAAEGLRRLHVGETMPEFNLTDIDGAAFAYKHERTRALGVLVLQAGQGNSERVVADIRTLVRELGRETPAFDCVCVVSGPHAREFIQAHSPISSTPLFLAPDPNFVFWGQLGVIATPTAVVVGSEGKVQWIRAGYGYDFIAGLHAQLRKALGLAGGIETSAHVEILENASIRARQDRHVHLARMLAQKGRIGPAAEELQKAYDLDPNATGVALELGEMLCRVEKNEAALKIATAAQVKTDPDKARSLLIRGWARRQMKQLDDAESLLERALELDPRSTRILYELGRVSESAGSTEKALAYYRRALDEVFGTARAMGSSQE